MWLFSAPVDGRRGLGEGAPVERVASARVLVVGAGGLGCPASLALAQAGVGHLTLVDPDRVDVTNLHRQLWHRTSDVGRLKVESAADGLRRAFPTLTVETLAERVDDPSYRDAGQQTSPPPTLSGTTPTTDGDSGTQAQGANPTVEACVDRWLQEHKMDQFGHPEGTMYAGGSPLFNEATGESKDRLEYVFGRNPEARKACAAKSAQ